MKSSSHEIGHSNYCIAMNFDQCLGSTAAEAPAKFQSDRIATFLESKTAVDIKRRRLITE